jgi:hypothetical protein
VEGVKKLKKKKAAKAQQRAVDPNNNKLSLINGVFNETLPNGKVTRRLSHREPTESCVKAAVSKVFVQNFKFMASCK